MNENIHPSFVRLGRFTEGLTEDEQFTIFVSIIDGLEANRLGAIRKGDKSRKALCEAAVAALVGRDDMASEKW